MMMEIAAITISSVLPEALSASTLGSSPELKRRKSSGSGLLDDHATNILIGVTSMLLVLCIVAVGGRLLARRMSKVKLEADDYLVVIALVSSFPILRIAPFVLIYVSSVSSDCALYRTIYAYRKS